MSGRATSRAGSAARSRRRVFWRLRRSPVVFRAVAGSATPWRDAWLAVRMAAWALAISVLKHFVPVSSLAKWMWKDAIGGNERDAVSEAQIARLAGWLSSGTNVTSRGACLQRSLVAYRYLSALGADPRLVVAFRKNDDAVIGHAWVEVDGRAVGEPDDVRAAFTPTMIFGAHGYLLSGPRQ